MPTYDHDHGKLAAAVTLDAVANDWSVLPGDMVALRNMGAIDGRWITETFEFDLLRPTGATITLIKPLPPLKEPAPEVVVKTIDKTGVNAPDGGKVGYPLAKRGTLIGVPYQGTHTLGNWQSDNAVDLGVPRGTKVLAVDDGTIVKTVDRPDGAGRFSGSQVTLNTATNAFFYTHLSQLGAQTGQQVHKGDVIGLSGEANGVAHLHFGAKNGDPRDLIGQTK
jgi:murein DD-endopeptidase MepM/ murein hydrolase activator NlpD